MKLLPAFLLALSMALTVRAADLGEITSPLAYAQSNPVAKVFEGPKSGPAPAVVTSLGTLQIGSDQVLDALKREMIARCGVDGDLHLSFARPWNGVEIRNDKDWRVVLEQMPGGFVTPSMEVVFRVEASGKTVGTLSTVDESGFTSVSSSLEHHMILIGVERGEVSREISIPLLPI
jgi:hypothetical protein